MTILASIEYEQVNTPLELIFLTLISSRDELWKDMFCRLVEDEAMPYHATAIHRWMQEELQIKAAMRACIKDLRRERDKVRIAYYSILRHFLNGQLLMSQNSKVYFAYNHGLLNTIKVLIFAFDIKEKFLGLIKVLKLTSAYLR